MGEGNWTLSVDQQGVTIASDRFRLTTSGASVDHELALDEAVFAMAESSQMEAVVTELESMTKRTYGQYCGLSRAMELVGERWTLLIIRDLSVSPKSVADLQRGLPRIPQDTLTARMRELEHAGVVTRLQLPDDAARYELSPFGSELEEILLRFGRWGSRMLGSPRPEEIITPESMVVAMRALFDPEAAHGVRASYEIRLGEVVFHIRVHDGTLHAGTGPLPGADLVLESTTALKGIGLMLGEFDAAEAMAEGSARVTGDPALLTRLGQMVHIPGRPANVRA
jgi:DNA-binding HxlR family transcriptional regulator